MKEGSAAKPPSRHVPAAPDPGPAWTTLDWPRRTGTTVAVLEELGVQVRRRRQRRRRIRGAVASTLLLLAGATAWHSQVPFGPAAPDAAHPMISTPMREMLPDGSVVLLRTGAQIAVEYNDASRHVRLLRGEALFDVAKHPERPFVVEAGTVRVRAIGTAFVVNLQHEVVEVLVTEGHVAVERTGLAAGIAPTDPEARPKEGQSFTLRTQAAIPAQLPSELDLDSSEWRLDAGKVIEVALSANARPPEVLPVSEAEINRRLGWRIPTLRFARTPLREAIAMINQHSPVRLVLEGKSLNQLPLSGAIRADNIDALLEFLESDFGIVAEHRSEAGMIVLKLQ